MDASVSIQGAYTEPRFGLDCKGEFHACHALMMQPHATMTSFLRSK